MTNDPIVAEVRRTRSALLKQCGNDLKKLVKHLEAQRMARGRKTVSPTTKRKLPA